MNDHGNADGLSRLPLPSTTPSSDTRGASTFNIGQVQALPVTVQDIQKATRRDALLSKVYRYVQGGWPSHVVDELRPYRDHQTELTTESGCLMWGIRVIIPKSLQAQVLKSLHENHPGITRMKMTAHSYFWWQGLDKNIEEVGKTCPSCRANQSNPSAAPLHPWIWPDTPWKRIHIDFAGPFLGHMFFVVVDAHSKWPEVEVLKSTTTEKTIEALKLLFARHGLPQQVISDNGLQFTSSEFTGFLRANRIKHILCAPYHPASNGQVERFVQTLKRTLKTCRKDGKTLHHRLAEFLLEYRATSHATTNVAPSELFLKRKLRTRFDLMLPNLKGYVTSKQADQKQYHDEHGKPRSLFPGTPVMVRAYIGRDKWIQGIVLRKLGPVTYQVEIANGRILKRHVDQLKFWEKSSQAIDQPRMASTDSTIEDDYHYPSADQSYETQEPTQSPERRYPQRQRRPPNRFTYS